MTTDTDGGLVNAALLDGQGGGTEVGWEAVRGWSADQGILWVHLDRNHETARRWLTEESGLAPLAAEVMLEEETRPRCVPFRDGLLVILRGVNLNPGADPDDMVAIRIWVDAHRVITVRARRLMAVQDVRGELNEGLGPADSGELLLHIANRLMDRVVPVVDAMSDMVDGLEDELLESENREIRARLRDMRRHAIGLRRYLSPQREALARLQQEEQPWFNHAHKLRVRETVDRVVRIVEELDEMRERAAVIQDELTNRISEQMNRTMYVLTVVASILLPLSFVTGLLGINVGGIPLAEDNAGFAWIVGILVIVGVAQIAIFRRLKWL